MVIDRATSAKIDSLLYEVRCWPIGKPAATVDELARRFRLDPLVVQRLLEAEGVSVEETLELEGNESISDVGRRVTMVLSAEELDAARRLAAGDGDGE